MHTPQRMRDRGCCQKIELVGFSLSPGGIPLFRCNFRRNSRHVVDITQIHRSLRNCVLVGLYTSSERLDCLMHNLSVYALSFDITRCPSGSLGGDSSEGDW